MRSFRHLYAAAALLLLLTGCNLENELSEPYLSEAPPSTSSPATSDEASVEEISTADFEPAEPLEPDDVIPAAVQTPKIEGSRLTYSISNVYSGGEYFTVVVSCIKLPETTEASELETTLINGDIYGDFRLELMQRDEIIDTLKINVPRDDSFLIFENLLKNLTYGCELISNMRDFQASEYPDLIRLDFTMLNEVEVPQYARYFTVSDKKLTEVPVYENGAETAPYGTHIEPQSAGLMIQHIVAKEYGSYTVKQYEYTFDPIALTITRKRVRYTGYN